MTLCPSCGHREAAIRSGFCTRCLFEHQRTEDSEGEIMRHEEHLDPLREAILAAVSPNAPEADATVTVRTGDSIKPPPPHKPDPLADAVIAAVGKPR